MFLMFLLLYCGVGILVLLASIFEWDWYFDRWWALWAVEIFGYDKARIANGIVGVILIARGIMRFVSLFSMLS